MSGRSAISPPRYVAVDRDGEEVVGAGRLDVLLLRLRGTKYVEVRERVAGERVRVPSRELEYVARQLRERGFADVV
jgi:hypothetical protein